MTIRLPLALTLSSLLILGLSFVIYLTLFSFTDADQATYRALLQKSDRSVHEAEHLQQTHQGVNKHFWWIKNGHRLQMELLSDHAVMAMHHKEIVEQMKNVSGVIQEELYYLLPDGQEATVIEQDRALLRNGKWHTLHPNTQCKPMQSFQYLEAKNASYEYHANRFVADQVKLSRYTLEGHELKKNIKNLEPTLTGTAQSVEMTFAEKEPQVVAKGFKSEHSLGKISAEHMEWLRQNDSDPLNQLKLQNQVSIQFRTGGILNCEFADIHVHDLIGHFKGGPQQLVSYQESTNAGPLNIVSQEMTAHFRKREQNYFLDQMTTDGQVSIHFQNEFNLSADQGVYQTQSDKQNPLVTLSSVNPEKPCYLCNKKGDYIYANPIQINTHKKSLLFTAPTGSLCFAPETENLDFSSDLLEWDSLNQVLTLLNHVIVSQPTMGTLKTDQQMKLTLYSKEEAAKSKKIGVKTIESTGHTDFSYSNPAKEWEHRLSCHGTVTLHHEDLTAELTSPISPTGDVMSDRQVEFHDAIGKIYADKVSVLYSQSEGQLKPTAITLEGNIRICNKDNQAENSKAYFQYALADRMEYNFDTQGVRLSALPGSRVLFFDAINKLQVSAPQLMIKRDSSNLKNIVQGKGDVRFSFIEQEQNLIKNKFSLESL